jgi:type II secretory pathway component GspD/PulD (secretin)
MQPTTLSWTSKMTVYVMRPVLGGILLTGLAMAQSTPPPANSFLATGTYRLTVTDRELSLDAAEASLAAILAEIEQRTGIPIVVYPGMNERVTIHLSPMPLDKAIKQLAPNVAIATARGPNAPPHRIAKVYVLPKGQNQLTQAEERPAGGPFQFSFDPSQH